MITSLKGGVGKSTVTANLALALAKEGRRTLAVDCDFTMRTLDLIMGHEDDVVYDICDIIRNDTPLEKAVIQDSRSENLYFCAAPYSYEGKIAPAVFGEKIRGIAEELALDCILMDTPGDSLSLLELVAAAADRAVIIASHQPASIRAAEKTSLILDELGIEDRKMIINSFNFKAVKKGILPGIINIIDRTYIQLIGVIPMDSRLGELQEYGALVDEIEKTNTAAAFTSIAQRICGKSLPLFYGWKPSHKSYVTK